MPNVVMRPVPIHSFLATLLLLIAAAPTGVSAAGIYEAAVAVDEQSPAVRDSALRHTLGQVLIRVTGNRHVTSTGQGQAVLAAAPRLVQVFRYERSDPDRLLFIARFDRRAVQNEVRAQGLPVWGDQRPSAVVWIAMRDDRGREDVLDAQQLAAMMPALSNAAAQRGVPLVLPLMDLEDRRLVTFSDIWSANDEALAQASQRYGGTHQLVGRISRRAGRWRAQWSMLDRGRSWLDWEATGASLDDIAATGIHELADRMADRYALLAYDSDGATTHLQVSGIRSLADYAKVGEYLEKLNPVTALQVIEVRPDTVLYAVSARGGDRFLEQAIGLGRILERETDYALDPDEDPLIDDDGAVVSATPSLLHYRLVGSQRSFLR